MKNCLSCKIKKECDFGVAVGELNEYKDSDDGLGVVVKLLNQNIEQYIDCECYEKQ